MFPVSDVTFPRVDTRLSSLSHSWHHFESETPSLLWDQQTRSCWQMSRVTSPVTKLSRDCSPGPGCHHTGPGSRESGKIALDCDPGSGDRTLDRRRPGPGTTHGRGGHTWHSAARIIYFVKYLWEKKIIFRIWDQQFNSIYLLHTFKESYWDYKRYLPSQLIFALLCRARGQGSLCCCKFYSQGNIKIFHKVSPRQILQLVAAVFV